MSSRNDPANLPPEAVHILFMHWVHSFAHLELGMNSLSHGAPSSEVGDASVEWGFTYDDGRGFRLNKHPTEDVWDQYVDPPFNDVPIRDITSRALDLSTSGVQGEISCFRARMTSPVQPFDHQFMRKLGDQRYIEGRRRLSDTILLNFEPDLIDESDPNPLFVPETSIDVYIFAPCPGGIPGPFSSRITEGALETVRLICTLALGRTVEKSVVPPILMSAEDAREQFEARYDPSVLSLARDSISLDLFGDFFSIAGPEFFLKARAAFIAYDAAIRQENPDVAVILLVSAIEALLVPNTAWRTERVTARFSKTLNLLCPEAVDALMAHGNFKEAYPVKLTGNPASRRLKLLNYIYQLRSSPVHEGPAIYAGLVGSGFASHGAMRVTLLSELTLRTIMAFLQRPLSSLIGHPEIHPGAPRNE